MTRYTLADLGGALSWGALSHFCQYLPRTSALSRELEPVSDAERWASGNVTAAILADIYDVLSQFNNNFCARASGRPALVAKPYERPWSEGTGTMTIGSDPIPVCDFEGWWASKGKGVD